MKNNPNVEKSFTLAKERYAAIGVDVEAVLKNLAKVPVSLHCWQGDDVGGFENYGGALTGGIMATGNYPGKARTPGELRADAEKALSLIPARTGSISTPSTASSAARKLTATKSSRNISRTGLPGPSRSASDWISIPPASRIPNQPTALHCRPPTRASASFGSSIARPAAKSALPWARRSARPPSPTSGFPMA